MSRFVIPMAIPIALLLLPLGGCGGATTWILGGRDCSVVRWDRGQAFCVALEAPPPPAFCARALGGVDCWTDPALLANRPHGLADNPAAPLTARKEAGAPPSTKETGPKPVAAPIAPVPTPPTPNPNPAPPMPGTRASYATYYDSL